MAELNSGMARDDTGHPICGPKWADHAAIHHRDLPDNGSLLALWARLGGDKTRYAWVRIVQHHAHPLTHGKLLQPRLLALRANRS